MGVGTALAMSSGMLAAEMALPVDLLAGGSRAAWVDLLAGAGPAAWPGTSSSALSDAWILATAPAAAARFGRVSNSLGRPTAGSGSGCTG